MQLLMLILGIALPLIRLWADPDRRRRAERAKELQVRLDRLSKLAAAVASESGEKVDDAVQKLFDRANAAGL